VSRRQVGIPSSFKTKSPAILHPFAAIGQSLASHSDTQAAKN
jgi:hypothetical protein